MLLRSCGIALLVSIGGAGCDDLDGSGLVLEVLAEQPRSEDLGVSLAVHARGGGSVFLSVEPGSFLTDTGERGHPPAAETSRCVPAGTGQAVFTFNLSVRPAESESLLFATLYDTRECTGAILQSRLLAVRPPTTNPVPQDAGATALETP